MRDSKGEQLLEYDDRELELGDVARKTLPLNVSES